MRWYERFPEVLDKEIAAYAEKGLDFSMNQSLLESKGVVVFEGTVRVADSDHQLQVRYSSMFPLKGVEVIETGQVYARHQNPRLGNLCVPRWVPGETGADKVVQAVELIGILSKGVEVPVEREVHAPEPASAWYCYTPKCSALIPEPFTRANIKDSGRFKLVVKAHMPIMGLVQGALVEISDQTSGTPRTVDLGPLASGETLAGPWFRSTQTPPFHLESYDDWVRWISDANKRFNASLRETKIRTATGTASIEAFAVVYPEEGAGYKQFRDQWQFCVRRKDSKGSTDWIMRPYVLPMGDMYFQRMPYLSGLTGKRVTILGLGAIGSVIAVELARAGVDHFMIIDGDDLRPGNVVRNASDLRAFGLPKVSAMHMQILYINPMCKVESAYCRIGSPPLSPEGYDVDEMARLEEIVQETDLFICATADSAVEYCVNDIARAKQVPSIYAAAFYGVWGGQVFRSTPLDPCFRCYQHSDKYGNVPKPEDHDKDMYLDGCSNPTFPGAGFDTSVLGNLATRLAVQTLLTGNGYPDAPYNLITWISRSDSAGEFPQIKFDTVEKRSVCPSCNPKSEP